MKTKFKSANKITAILLAHGEKIGMAAVLVVAGLLIKASLGRERLPEDKYPGQLSAKAQDAQRHYEQMSWENFPPEEKVDAAAQLKMAAGGGVMKPVNEGDFPILETSLDPPVVPPIGKRMDPELLAPTDLEVNAASGLWAYDNPEVIRQRALAAAEKRQQEEMEERRRRQEEEEAERRGRRRDRDREDNFRGEGYRGYGGMSGIEMTDDNVAVIRPNMAATPEGLADIQSESWVTVLAKVPIRQQVQRYKDALASASGYNEQYDMPEYIGYVVERAEVTEEGQQEWVQLPSVLKRTIIRAMEQRPFEPPEVADEKYKHPLLTWPLPPMVLRAWGGEVTHSDLPVPTLEDMYAEQMAAAQQQEAPEEAEEGLDEFQAQQRREARAQTPQMGYGREEFGPPGMGSPYGGREMPMPYGGRGEMMGEYGGYGRGGYGGYGEMAMGRGAGAYENLPDKAWDGRTRYYLFRYFDNTVEPGRRYRYRVKLALADANADRPQRRIPPMFLDKTVTDRKAQGPKDKNGNPVTYRFTEWSEPSPVASVPQPGLIYVTQVKRAANVTVEPQAEVLVKSLDANHVAEVGRADWYSRGSVINRIKEKAHVIWSSAYRLEEEENRQSPFFNFLTSLTLLDFTGGEVLYGNRELLAPARALVMDSTGRMMVEEELADQMPIREYKAIMNARDEARRNRQDEDRDRDDRRGGRRR